MKDWGELQRHTYDNVTNAVNIAKSIFLAFSSASETTKNGVVLDVVGLGMPSKSFAPASLTRWLHGRKRARSLLWQDSAIELDNVPVCSVVSVAVSSSLDP